METEMKKTLFRERLIRRPEVEELTGLKKSSIYQKAKDGTFPAPLKISQKAVAWRLGSILDWMEALPQAKA